MCWLTMRIGYGTLLAFSLRGFVKLRLASIFSQKSALDLPSLWSDQPEQICVEKDWKEA